MLRPVALGDIPPRRARPQLPEQPVQDTPVVAPRVASRPLHARCLGDLRGGRRGLLAVVASLCSVIS